MLLSNNIIFAQENDDVPYLSDEDIAAIELTLPDDIPDNLRAEENEINNEVNEISRLNTSFSLYHLLILDRTRCRLNSDIGDLKGIDVLYKFKHGTNGYIIAVYKTPQKGPVFPQLPDKSRILVDLITARKVTIKEYINSSAFRRFVKNSRVFSDLQKIMESDI
jgi:hypothetical protein